MFEKHCPASQLRSAPVKPKWKPKLILHSMPLACRSLTSLPAAPGPPELTPNCARFQLRGQFAWRTFCSRNAKAPSICAETTWIMGVQWRQALGKTCSFFRARIVRFRRNCPINHARSHSLGREPEKPQVLGRGHFDSPFWYEIGVVF